MKYWSDLALALMRLKPGFTTLFSAWSTSYAAYSVCCLAYLSPRQAEDFAQQQRLGVWTDPNSEKPWDYRKARR